MMRPMTLRNSVPSRRIKFCGVRVCAIAHTVIHRSLRPGEQILANGDVVIHGDVPPDGSIEAEGDVMVWGRLSGRAHAGAAGNVSAKISALELRGAHLQISNVTSLAAARITAPGPHTASVSCTGGSHKLSMQLLPLGPPHPPAAPAGLSRDFRRFLEWYPAAAAALFTGLYAVAAGAALLVAPKTVLGLLFDASSVSPGWIRLGAVLFATFGLQYLGTALADWWQCSSSSQHVNGVPGVPFRADSPDLASMQQQQQQQQGGVDGTAGSGTSRSSAGGRVQEYTGGGVPLGMPADYLVQFAGAAAAGAPAAARVPGAVATAAAGSQQSISSISSSSSRQMSNVSVDTLGTVWERLSGSGAHKHTHQQYSAVVESDEFVLQQPYAELLQPAAGSSSSSSSKTPALAALCRPAATADTTQQEQQQEQEQLRMNVSSASLDEAQHHVAAAAALAASLHSCEGLPPHATPSAEAAAAASRQGSSWLYSSTGFYEASVWSRLLLAAAFGVLVVAGQCQPGLLVLAGLNAMGALSMMTALRRQWMVHVMGDMPATAAEWM